MPHTHTQHHITPQSHTHHPVTNILEVRSIISFHVLHLNQTHCPLPHHRLAEPARSRRLKFFVERSALSVLKLWLFMVPFPQGSSQEGESHSFFFFSQPDEDWRQKLRQLDSRLAAPFLDSYCCSRYIILVFIASHIAQRTYAPHLFVYWLFSYVLCWITSPPVFVHRRHDEAFLVLVLAQTEHKLSSGYSCSKA